jgi:ComF family protein
MGVQSSGGVILPEGVFAQHALWNFDKGGQLQDLLHHLKYNRLSGVGEDLGKALGQSFRRNRFLDVDQDSAVLVPVPLHPGKKRKRGYNQARYIAKGVEVATEIAVCDPEDVIRVKNTRTQTGFSLEKRRKNIEGAFKVNKEDMFRGKVCIIVDDVFTTGATTFELASVLLRSGAVKILITTVAQA